MEAVSKQFRKRNAVLSCLQQTRCHPSAEMLYQMLKQDHPDISLPTVYRNLARFKEQGLIVSLGQVNGAERFDGFLGPHAHLICTGCGTVEDVFQGEGADTLCEHTENSHGWMIQGVQLVYSGLCPRCQSDSKINL